MPLPAFLIRGSHEGPGRLLLEERQHPQGRRADRVVAGCRAARDRDGEADSRGLRQVPGGGGQALKGSCPGIRCRQADFAAYGRIVFGAPVWAGKAASPINTFLRDYPISEKVVGFLDTSLSGKDERCVEALRKALSKLASTVALFDWGRDDASVNEARIEAFVGGNRAASMPGMRKQRMHDAASTVVGNSWKGYARMGVLR